MPSAAAMARSSGVVIKPRTSSASAPTYTVVTVIAAMSLRGYCRTLMVLIACKPAMRITKLTTRASTGRRIKRSVKDFMPLFPLRIYRRRIYLRLGREIVVDRYRHAVAQFENAGTDDRLASFQSRRHRHKIAARLPDAHKLLPDHL